MVLKPPLVEIRTNYNKTILRSSYGLAPSHISIRRSSIVVSSFFSGITTSKIKQEHPFKYLFSKYKENKIKKTDRTLSVQALQMEGVPKKGFLLRPCIPLVEEKNQEPVAKHECVKFTLKAKSVLGQEGGPTGQKVGAFKKSFKIFKNGTVPEWIETLGNIRQVWTCNNVTGPHERVGIIFSILKDEALEHFEGALRELQEPTENNPKVELTNEMVEKALLAVSSAVFPHRALETQKLWMKRHLKKPRDMKYRVLQSRVLKMNNSLPLFPGADENAKFSPPEILEILEYSLPQSWRSKFDLDGYLPSKFNKERLLQEAEAVERHQIEEKPLKKQKKSETKLATKKRKSLSNSPKKTHTKFCTEHGSGNHSSAECWKLHPELAPDRKLNKRIKTAKTSQDLTKSSKKQLSEMLLVQQKVNKNKKATIEILSSDSEESTNHMEICAPTTSSPSEKEKKLQAYKLKMAKAQENDSE